MSAVPNAGGAVPVLTVREERRAMASAVRIMALLNSCVVVVAALYFGQELLVPLVLAALLAFVLAPLARLLTRFYVPRILAVLLAVVIAFVVIGLVSTVVAQQVSGLLGQLPQYEANAVQKWQRLVQSNRLVAEVSGPLQAGLSAGDHGSMLSLAERFARPLLGPLTTFAIVLVFALVILLYSEDLRDRFVRLAGRHDLHRTIFAMNDAGRRLSRYFLSQLTLNAGFGVWIAAGLALIGVPAAILLGLIAMLMRFVPFIGTFIGLVPPLALAIATTPDWTAVLLVLALYGVSELIVSQALEPLLYGHSTGISPVAVLVASSFWALIWGFVGLLIATPLTVCLVVIGRNVPALAFLDVLFGSGSPLLPSETFYQRALERRSIALLPSARAHVSDNSLADYYDQVALPGLVLAQADLAADPDEVERLDPVHEQVSALLAALDGEALPEQLPVSPGWAKAGSIICLPARGPLDDVTAEMTAQSLRRVGFGAVALSNTVLDNAAPRDAPETASEMATCRLCCLCVLEDTGTSMASIRFFAGKIQRTLPRAEVVVGLWHATAASPLLAALREAGGQQHVILSIGELVAYVRAVSVQALPEPVDA